jgi:hypothetical protein
MVFPAVISSAKAPRFPACTRPGRVDLPMSEVSAFGDQKELSEWNPQTATPRMVAQ